uniref:Uncharacterized protein n=1 Tax=Pseudomonas putida TaxID=303 RepID=A0A7M1HVZ3_PSEPU|nr:Hypothetical protein [Pseudomonas putida]
MFYSGIAANLTAQFYDVTCNGLHLKTAGLAIISISSSD